jgi:hypothetical protein
MLFTLLFLNTLIGATITSQLSTDKGTTISRTHSMRLQHYRGNVRPILLLRYRMPGGTHILRHCSTYGIKTHPIIAKIQYSCKNTPPASLRASSNTTIKEKDSITTMILSPSSFASNMSIPSVNQISSH